MTEDINELQRECMKPEMDPRSLFVIGSILDSKKNYMSPEQARVQKMIEGTFQQRIMRVMGYQTRRQ